MSGERLGRRLLRLDAVYCFAAGVIALVLSVPLGRLLDIPAGVPAAVGLATIVWALLLGRLAIRPDWRGAVARVAAANVVGAAAIGALAVVAPATAGRLLLAAVAVEVAAFAAGQIAVLRRYPAARS